MRRRTRTRSKPKEGPKGPRVWASPQGETLWPKYLSVVHYIKYLEETYEDANISDWNQINI